MYHNSASVLQAVHPYRRCPSSLTVEEWMRLDGGDLPAELSRDNQADAVRPSGISCSKPEVDE